MAFRSVSPLDGQVLAEFEAHNPARLDEILADVAAITPAWAATPVEVRCQHLRDLATLLGERKEELARLTTLEMGKLYREAVAEIEKCAWGCSYYADQAPAFLADEVIESDAGRSLVAYQPLGTVLAVMPWNFPFWQVFRFAAPALAAGNTALLKHAANVPQCALAIERVIADAGLPAGVFRTLLLPSDRVADVVADDRVHAVTLTGSAGAGRSLAAAAGRALKKSVLELGGSDPFIVLEDADLDLAVRVAVQSRFQNAGQSCIAAKRFIPVEPVAEAFVERFRAAVEALRPGDPMEPATTLAPLARHDLRDELHRQVSDSLAQGAVALTGCRPLLGPGAYYQPSILDRVRPGMRAYSEELFGPVAVVIRARDEADAVRIANDSRFGLSGSVWTADRARGERVARRLQAGAVFVNGLVKSDPRLPFGGVRESGYGRELSYHGIREFTNIKTLWLR